MTGESFMSVLRSAQGMTRRSGRTERDRVGPWAGSTALSAEVAGDPPRERLGLDRGNEAVRLNVAGALRWTAMRWAKASGYRYFDVGDLRESTMEALAGSGPLDVESLDSPDRYKIRFGGKRTGHPTASSDGRRRWVACTLVDRVSHWSGGRGAPGPAVFLPGPVRERPTRKRTVA